jgi:triphosphoribosyl-dephospho-CoA synthetase
MEAARHSGVGKTVLDAVRATRGVCATNTNLGTVLLMAPLAGIARDNEIASSIARVLERLTPQVASDVYTSIRRFGSRNPAAWEKRPRWTLPARRRRICWKR